MKQVAAASTAPQISRWVGRARESALGISAGVLGGILINSTDLTEKILKLTDRLGWTHSEQVVLAQDTAKSKFSDALIRAAWKRLFLADLFARRTLDATSVPSIPQQTVNDINEAWDKYISALIDCGRR